MSFASDCPSCSMGKHDGHDWKHGLRPGLIGGAHCACEGDCAERYRAATKRIAEILGDPAGERAAS